MATALRELSSNSSPSGPGDYQRSLNLNLARTKVPSLFIPP
jgi:hypothetical protein